MRLCAIGSLERTDRARLVPYSVTSVNLYHIPPHRALYSSVLILSDLERHAAETLHGTGRAELTSRSQASSRHGGQRCLLWLKPNTSEQMSDIVYTMKETLENLKTSSDCFWLTSCKSSFCHNRLDVRTASGLRSLLQSGCTPGFFSI